MFRLFLLLTSAIFWGLLAWLATHVSDTPIVLARYSVSYFVMLSMMLLIAVSSTAALFGELHKRLHRNRQVIGVVFASTVFSLMTAEFLVRMFDPMGISFFEESRRYHLDKQADDRLFYRHRSGLDTFYQGVRVQTNEIGLRDTPIAPKQAREFRVLALGDSVTFGWGVQIENTYPKQLERMLAEQSANPIRVINSGVGSYNTDQELTFARLYMDELTPDAVVLLYVVNDIEINKPPFDPWAEVSLRGKNPLTQIRLLAWNSWLYRMLSFVALIQRRASDGPPARQSEGWQRSMAALEELAELCRGRSIPLLVVLYRLHESQFTNGLDEDIASRAAQLGFLYRDSLPWLSVAETKDITNSIVDIHPNIAGHALIAEGIYQTMIEQQVW